MSVITKPIPTLDGYYATSDGRILNSLHQEEKVHTYVKTGDSRYMVTYPNGKFEKHAIATLVAQTFLEVPIYLKGNLIVLHFDGNKGNDHVDNLDWVDNRWFRIFRNVQKGNTVISKFFWIELRKGKELIKFANLQQVADYLKVSTRTVWDAMKVTGEVKGYTVRYYSEIAATDTRDKINKGIARTQPGIFSPDPREVKVIHLKTGEILAFNSMTAAARHFNVKMCAIRNRLSTPDVPKVFQKEYVIIDANKNFDFLTDTIKKKLLLRVSNKVVVHDSLDNSIAVYGTPTEFMKKNSRYPTGYSTVARHLETSDVVRYKEYTIARLPEEEEHNPDLYMITKIINMI